MRTYSKQPATDAVWYDLTELGPKYKLTEGLTLGEFASKDGDKKVLVHPMLVGLYAIVRKETGFKFRVNSGYRSKAHNKKQGGRPSSYHLKGMAIDVTPIVPALELPAALVRTKEVALKYAGGIEVYESKGFIHLDVGPIRYWEG